MTAELIRPAEPNPLAMIDRAIDKGFSTEQLKVLFDLHSQWNADRAREAFEAAMVATQAEAEAIVKTTDNNHTKKKYAALESIVPAIKPTYTANGLRLSFSEGDCPKADHMRVVCEVGHKLGHTRTYYLDMPLDGAGIKGAANMTPTQGKGSTFTYGSRYLTVRIFNIPIVGEDQDGNGANGPTLDEDSIKLLRESMQARGIDEGRFLKLANAKSIDEIYMAEMTKCIRWIQSLASQKAKEGGGR